MQKEVRGKNGKPVRTTLFIIFSILAFVASAQQPVQPQLSGCNLSSVFAYTNFASDSIFLVRFFNGPAFRCPTDTIELSVGGGGSGAIDCYVDSASAYTSNDTIYLVYHQGSGSSCTNDTIALVTGNPVSADCYIDSASAYTLNDTIYFVYHQGPGSTCTNDTIALYSTVGGSGSGNAVSRDGRNIIDDNGGAFLPRFLFDNSNTSAGFLDTSGVTIWISPRGDDLTGKIGSPFHPFLTGQAAVDAAAVIIDGAANNAIRIVYLGGNHNSAQINLPAIGQPVEVYLIADGVVQINTDNDFWIERNASEGLGVYVWGGFQVNTGTSSAFDGANVNIWGRGAGVTTFDCASTSNNGCLGSIQSNSYYISNLTITNSAAGASFLNTQSAVTWLDNVEVINESTGDAIRVGNAGRLKVTNSYIESVDGYAVNNISFNSVGWIFKNCHVVCDQTACFRYLRDLTIQDCYIENTQSGSVYGILNNSTQMGVYNTVINLPNGSGSPGSIIEQSAGTITVHNVVSTHGLVFTGGGGSNGSGVTIASPINYTTW